MADIQDTQENDLEYQEYDSFDVEKKKDMLRSSQERLKTVIDEQVDELKENASAWGKALLLAGGSVYITYKIIKGVFRRRKRARFERRIIAKVASARYPSHRQSSSRLPIQVNRGGKGGFSLADFIKSQLILLAVAIAKRRLRSMIGDLPLLNKLV
ncbi:hypothetical protein BH23BAC1_BH23BAC1_02660 [soil metagenome]